MAFNNIGELSGTFTGSGDTEADIWTFTGDITEMSVVSGNFTKLDENNDPTGYEAQNGYSFGALSNPSYGSLTFNTLNGRFTFTINHTALYASGSDQTVTFTVTGFDPEFDGGSDTDTVVINLLICVARGTLIDTAEGPKRVETLRIGDLVTTRDDGEQPIRWIGSRKVSAPEIAADPDLRPIRIRAGALGNHLPWRDLLLSPQHRVLLSDWRAQIFFGEDEVLAPARSLVNDSTILRDVAADGVEYFHVLFDRHQIMLTEGAPTESFHPGAWAMSALDSAARIELLTLFPELETDDYGPLARPTLKMREACILSDQLERSAA